MSESTSVIAPFALDTVSVSLDNVEQISKIGLDEAKFDRDKSQPSVAVRIVQMTLAGRCLQVMFVCQMKHRVPIQHLISETSAGERSGIYRSRRVTVIRSLPARFPLCHVVSASRYSQPILQHVPAIGCMSAA